MPLELPFKYTSVFPLLNHKNEVMPISLGRMFDPGLQLYCDLKASHSPSKEEAPSTYFLS